MLRSRIVSSLMLTLQQLAHASPRRSSGGVITLGATTLDASRSLVPEQLYPWLGLLSGITIAGLGCSMLLRQLIGAASGHSHGMDGLHGRHPLPGSAPASQAVAGPLARRWLLVASSLLITALGVIIVVRALASTNLNLHQLTQGKLGTVLFVSGLGLILGMRHSTDADHVVAISTILSKQRSIRNAAVIGSVWGLGHTITIFIVGSLIILFGVEIPPRLGLSMEFCVALMLILLGVLNLTGVMQKISSRFTHMPALGDKENRRRSESVSKTKLSRLYGSTVGQFGFYQYLRPLFIGLVHGLAGSAAVALLVLTTIHNPVWATVYLLIFGFGTMIGMMCMTAAIAVPLTYAGDYSAKLSRYFGVVSGMVSLCFGCFLVYQLGFLGGLFTSHPQWTPR